MARDTKQQFFQALYQGKMKTLTLVIFFIIGVISCNPKILQQSFEKKCYQSERGHLFTGNKICFNSDSSFQYVGNGPSTFISNGKWKYNSFNKEIELTSITSNNPNNFKNRVDTMWVNLTGKKINVKSSSQIVFEEIIYRFK
ncbi:MAG: hypothetical protein QM541_05905 [Flavobacterium sp.]|nr:hypothetical protein [Flavobacterium sp.]